MKEFQDTSRETRAAEKNTASHLKSELTELLEMFSTVEEIRFSSGSFVRFYPEAEVWCAYQYGEALIDFDTLETKAFPSPVEAFRALNEIGK